MAGKTRGAIALEKWVRAQRRFDLTQTDNNEQDKTLRSRGKDDAGPGFGGGGAGPTYEGPQETRWPVGDYSLQPTETLLPSVLTETDAIDAPRKNAAWRVRVRGRQAAPMPLSLKEINGPPAEPNPAGDEHLELVEDVRQSEDTFEDVNLILD